MIDQIKSSERETVDKIMDELSATSFQLVRAQKLASSDVPRLEKHILDVKRRLRFAEGIYHEQSP